MGFCSSCRRPFHSADSRRKCCENCLLRLRGHYRPEGPGPGEATDLYTFSLSLVADAFRTGDFDQGPSSIPSHFCETCSRLCEPGPFRICLLCHDSQSTLSNPGRTQDHLQPSPQTG